MTEFFRTLTLEKSREYLNSYTVEEVRQLLEEGAFGDKMTEGLRQYLSDRIRISQMDH